MPLALVPRVAPVAAADAAALADAAVFEYGSALLVEEPARSVQAVAGLVEAHSGGCWLRAAEYFSAAALRSVAAHSADVLPRAAEKRSDAGLHSVAAYSAACPAAGRWYRTAVLLAARPEPTTDYSASRGWWSEAEPADCSPRAAEQRSAAAPYLATVYSAAAR